MPLRVIKVGCDLERLLAFQHEFCRVTESRSLLAASCMARIRAQGLLGPFIVCSLLLIVPTLVYLTYNSPKAPRNDGTTTVAFNQLYEVGDEIEGDVIMPKLPNATAK